MQKLITTEEIKNNEIKVFVNGSFLVYTVSFDEINGPIVNYKNNGNTYRFDANDFMSSLYSCIRALRVKDSTCFRYNGHFICEIRHEKEKEPICNYKNGKHEASFSFDMLTTQTSEAIRIASSLHYESIHR